ncbi:hypothetical protein DFH09DRAFT_443179 [Mycena vulgaris]|nr:hypothetical protein DFH09DRAFT_443179 [Mycena vulgaris]
MSHDRPGFFAGCTNFEISGGVFNDIAGDLNQFSSQHFAVQYNQVNGDMARYNSPTIVNFGGQAPPMAPNLRYDPGRPRRGAGRGNHSGIRMAPYSNSRGSEQSAFQADRISGRGGIPSQYNGNPSWPAPQGGAHPRAQHPPQHPPQHPGADGGFLNAARRENPWTYIPPPMPSPSSHPSHRNPEPADDTLSDAESPESGDEGDDQSDDESEDGARMTLHSDDSASLQGPNNNRTRQRRQSV